MKEAALIVIACLLIGSASLCADEAGKATVKAVVGTSPDPADAAAVMIQTAPAKSAEDNKPIAPPPPRCAADWVAAWQAAKDACPEASGMTIHFKADSGNAKESLVVECMDIKARGELLVITIKQPGAKEESVMIIRAPDVVRIEAKKPAPAVP